MPPFNPFQAASVRRQAARIEEHSTQDIRPTFPQMPKNQASFDRKWNEIGPPSLRRIPAADIRTVYEMDKRRVSAGQRPYTRPETARMLASAAAGRPLVEPPDESLNPLQTIPRDLGQIAQGILHLPAAAYHALTNLDESAQAIGEGIATGNPKRVLEAPLAAFIPGAYVAGNVLAGDFEELARHPVMSVLDVLPVASKAAEFTPAGKLAKRVMTHGATAERPLRPLRAALTKKVEVIEPAQKGGVGPPVGPTYDFVNNKLGEALERTNSTLTAQWLKPKVGHDAGVVSQKGRREEAAAAETAFGTGAIPDEANYQTNSRGEFVYNEAGERIYHGLGDMTRMIAQKMDERHNLTPEEKQIAVQAGFERNVNSPRYQALPDNIRAYIDDVDEATRFFADRTAPDIGVLLETSGKNGRLPDYMQGLEVAASWHKEIYTAKQAEKLHRLEWMAGQRRLKVRREVVPRLRALSNLPDADPRIAQMVDILDNAPGNARNYARALKLWQELKTRRTNLGTTPQNAYDIYYPKGDVSVRRVRPGVGSSDLGGGRTGLDAIVNMDKKLEQLVRSQGNYERGMLTELPARWGDWAVEKANRQALAKIATDKGQDVADRVAQNFVERNYQPLFDEGLLSHREFTAMIRDIGFGWRDAQAAGVNPVYIHHVVPSQIRGMEWPRVLPEKRSPTQAMERGFSLQPFVPDHTLALTHQGMELLTKLGRERFIEYILRAYGQYEGKLRQVFDERGNLVRSEHGTVPTPLITTELMQKQYAKFDPAEFLGYSPSRFVDLTGKDIWIPKHVMTVLEQMRKPMQASGLGVVWDPVMGLYRTSVLTLSPRWQLNNIIGGYLMLSAETNPLTAFTMMRKARKLMRGEEVTIRGEKMSVPSEFRTALGQARREMQGLNYMQLGGGATLRRWFDQSFLGRNGTAQRIGAIIGKPITTVVDGSIWLNTFFDDMYRSMSYLYGYDKAIGKGLDEAARMRAGMSLVNKIMPQWDALTPFERSVVRSVFPFYTWMQHIVKYSFNFPLDHPFRAMVISKLIGQEMVDEETGWPTAMRAMLLLGDNKHDTLGIKLGGGNPWADVSSMMTLQGFVRASNPLIGTGLNTLGIGKSGSADLFPDLDYDPYAGRLVADTGNPLMNLVFNTIPQAESLRIFMNRMKEFDADWTKDPKTQMERFYQGLGIPQYWERMNLAEEAAKRDQLMFEQQEKDYAEGLRGGDDAEIDKWPGNRAKAATIRQAQELQSPWLTQFQPGTLEADQQEAIRQQS